MVSEYTSSSSWTRVAFRGSIKIKFDPALNGWGPPYEGIMFSMITGYWVGRIDFFESFKDLMCSYSYKGPGFLLVEVRIFKATFVLRFP